MPVIEEAATDKSEKCFAGGRTILSSTGFSLTEVLTVIAIMAIVAGISAPTFIEWQQNLGYKQAASDIANALKMARSRAISYNRQYGLKLTTTDNTFTFGRYSGSLWYYGDKTALPKQVTLNLNGTDAPPAPNIRFSYNGSTFDNYSIRVKDSVSGRYTVYVERTGRIKLTKVKL